MKIKFRTCARTPTCTCQCERNRRISCCSAAVDGGRDGNTMVMVGTAMWASTQITWVRNGQMNVNKPKPILTKYPTTFFEILNREVDVMLRCRDVGLFRCGDDVMQKCADV